MKIISPLTLSIEFDMTDKCNEISKFFNELTSFFELRNYGESIQTYVIGTVCVSHGFDPFFKDNRKPRYIEDKLYKDKRLGIDSHICRTLEFSIKLDYDFFYPSNKEEGLKYIAQEIMTTVRLLKYPKKVVDFDRKRFESDLESFFIEQGLL